jgi:hypothetical protein
VPDWQSAPLGPEGVFPQPTNRRVRHIRVETIANGFPVVDDVGQIIACACGLQARLHHNLTRRMAISHDAEEGPH